jgi:hypothetical protein
VPRAYRCAAALAVLCGLIAGAHVRTAAQGPTLMGRVTDDAGRPLTAAEIEFVGAGPESRALSRKVQADGAGQYLIDAPVPAGTLSISAPGFVTVRLRVTPSTSIPLDVQLTDSRSLTGRVVLAGGRSSAPARIRAIQSGRVMTSVTVDAAADGTFSITGLSPGLVELVARAEGYAPEEVELQVRAGTGPIVMVLQPMIAIAGLVRDQFGELRGGAEVEVHQPAPRKGRIHVVDLMKDVYVTEPSGRFRILLVRGRPAWLSVQATGCAEQTLDADVLQTTNEVTLFCNK